MTMATALLMLLLVAPAAYAVEHTVGDSAGWTDTGDYTTWAEGKTFNVGDTLVFTYGGSHSVDVVNKDGYDNCDSSNALESHSGGSTTITLSSTGPMYFICPTPGHCAGGMKLSITVVAASTPSTPTTPSTPSGSSPPAAGTPTTTPSSGSPPTTESSSPPPPPPPSDSAAGGFDMSYVIFVLSVVLGSAFA